MATGNDYLDMPGLIIRESKSMNAYLYKAALFCGPCVIARLIQEGKAGPAARDMDPAEALRQIVESSGLDYDNESTWDSDDLPKGPYDQGGGEADYACHCDTCGLFLENPLTRDGKRHVLDSIRDHVLQGEGDRDVVAVWCAHYLGFDLPAAPFDYDALRNDYSDDGDAWGTCVIARHDIAAELYMRGEVPESWEYRTGAHDPREIDQDESLLSSPFAETCALASTDALITFGNVLQLVFRQAAPSWKGLLTMTLPSLNQYRDLNQRLSNLARCAEEAPAGTYEPAKAAYKAVDAAIESVRSILQAHGLRASGNDDCRVLELMIYGFLLDSNANNDGIMSGLIVGEGFGEAMDGPAAARVKAQTIRDRDQLRQLGVIK